MTHLEVNPGSMILSLLRLYTTLTAQKVNSDVGVQCVQRRLVKREMGGDDEEEQEQEGAGAVVIHGDEAELEAFNVCHAGRRNRPCP